MSPVTAPALSDAQREQVSILLKDFRAALSYLSFYSPDSPFVAQATHRFHEGLSRLLETASPLVFQAGSGDLRINGIAWEDSEVVLRILWARPCPGFSVSRGLPLAECHAFLKSLAAPDADDRPLEERMAEGEQLPHFRWIPAGEPVQESPVVEDAAAPPPPEPAVAHSAGPVLTGEALHDVAESPTAPDPKGLLSLVAEAWQLSRQVERHLVETPQARSFLQLFRRFFGHLLDRVGTVSTELGSIQGWFQSPEGEEIQEPMEAAMQGLLAVAVEKGWTDVLYDPAATGLVSECMAHWGATGRHEVLERTVEALAKGLQRDINERELALTHLMDSRPWVANRRLVGTILDRLTAQLSEETDPGLYQKGLLIAWDLLDPAIEAGLDAQVLALLSTLHLHADDEAPVFPERPALVRQWILGKSGPDLVRHLVDLAQRRRRLAHFPLLSALAAPILLKDFYAAGPEEVPKYLRIFGEMREQIQAALVERLPMSVEEMEVHLLLLIVRTSGIDPALSLQISAWMAKGSPELKESILNTIEEVGDPGGGPALRLALLDDDERIAMEAARILAKIGFKPAVPLMMKAVKMRKDHGKPWELYQAAVCRALGVFEIPETLPYLMEQAHKKTLFGGGAPLSVREAAVRAMAHFPQPGVAAYLDELVREGEGLLRKAVEEERETLLEVGKKE